MNGIARRLATREPEVDIRHSKQTISAIQLFARIHGSGCSQACDACTEKLACERVRLAAGFAQQQVFTRASHSDVIQASFIVGGSPPVAAIQDCHVAKLPSFRAM